MPTPLEADLGMASRDVWVRQHQMVVELTPDGHYRAIQAKMPLAIDDQEGADSGRGERLLRQTFRLGAQAERVTTVPGNDARLADAQSRVGGKGNVKVARERESRLRQRTLDHAGEVILDGGAVPGQGAGVDGVKTKGELVG